MTKKPSPEIHAYFSTLGKKGGAGRSKALSKARRLAISRMGVKAMLAKLKARKLGA